MRSFLAVTGPKNDLWLVKTVGVMVSATGLALAIAAGTGSVSPPVIALAVGSAGGLAVIDVVYVARGVIAPIYLLDALLEVGLIVAWVVLIIS
jgi:hypothetical protein